jgi:ribosomal protein S27E
MPGFITLSCPACGNKLQITEDIDRVACAACGNEHIVNRSGGVITLKPVIIDNTVQSDNIITTTVW